MDNSEPSSVAGPVLAISSIFGDPRDRSTWSAAPAAVAEELERLGFAITGIDVSAGTPAYAVGGIVHLLSGYGSIRYSEAIARGALLRHRRAARVAAALRRHGLTRVLHTGTLDLPPVIQGNGIRHFLYCDTTWNLSLRYRPDGALYTRRALAAFDRLEHMAYAACEHIFTFGSYVRDNLIGHYGIAPERVTAIGSGCGATEPYTGDKDYAASELLFVAKHLFREKGGELLLEAFRLALAHRPDLRLTIVGGSAGRKAAFLPPNVTIKPFVDRETLTRLMQRAALLVQPMLNDPWGQVYLEALLARTPVIGLDRNGLPEITRNGSCGFLVGEATPEALACAILDAVSNPARLDEMGTLGQHHVTDRYSWERVAAVIAAVLEARDSPLTHDSRVRDIPPSPLPQSLPESSVERIPAPAFQACRSMGPANHGQPFQAP